MGNTTNKDIEFESYTLSDIGVIELLIKYRYKYDENFYLNFESSLMTVNGVSPINEEVIVTYVSLDQYIKQCKFNATQLKMIEMIGNGYTNEEIAKANGMLKTTVAKRLQTIYRKIKKQNDWEWRKVSLLEKLELKGKECSKCKESLPATDEFYRARKDNKGDGFYNKCRKCEE